MLSSVIIGKIAQDYTRTYIRRPGSNDVYSAAGALAYAFRRDRGQWLDKNVMKLRPDSVISVEIVHPDAAYRLNREEATWKISKKPYTTGVLADSTKAQSFVNRLCNMRARDFAGPQDSGRVNFDRLSLVLKLTTLDSLTYTIEFADAPDSTAERYYCRRTDLPADTLVFAKSRFDSFRNKFADFLP